MDEITETQSPTASAGKRRWLFGLMTALMVMVLSLFVLVVAEFVSRELEFQIVDELQNTPDAVLGWLPKPGKYLLKTEEFETTFSVNALNMNDREWTSADEKSPIRILAVGDSHTFAIGASTGETWPKRTEAALFERPDQGIVMNAGMIGYSLGQYLLRYRQTRDVIKPTMLLVGFSMATDLYDLVPPERGGFVYGGDADRVFFDIGPDGQLLERTFKKTAVAGPQKVAFTTDSSTNIRSFLAQFSLYKRLKRSDLAMAIATYYRPNGKSLWPGMDTALQKNLSSDDQYRWRLAELIIARMADEAKANNTKMVLVNIPYVAQVYDEVWASSFGQRPEVYDRHLGSKRLKEICDRHGITLIDTTDAFTTAARERKHWLHWPIDAHPNPEGQHLIADVVAQALKKKNLIQPVKSPG